MKPSGTIYKSTVNRGLIHQTLSGEVRLALTQKEKERFKLLRFIGANISSLAIAFAVFFYGPLFEMDLNYQAGLTRASASNLQLATSNLEKQEKEDNQISNYQLPVTENFAISIPAIGASANIIKNVNPYHEPTYLEALKKGIAHAEGTALPGEGGRVYLFAHSTNSPLNYSEYNAVFYQLRLLSEGDRIFVNYNGDSFIYIVKEKVVVAANDTHWLTGESNSEQLVLQTCDPPGTTLRRLLVIAEPAS